MSWIRQDGIIHTSDYKDYHKKDEKQAIALIERFGELLDEVDKIGKELRLYALKMEWFDNSTSIIGAFEDFVYLADNYEETRSRIFTRLNAGDKIIKLKDEIIKLIKEREQE